MTVWGDGSASREFLYVQDCAEAFALALELYDDPEPVNLGTGEEVTIKELVELVRDVTEYDGRIEWDTSRPNGQPRRSLSVDRAERVLGWRATTPFSEGLARTLDWWNERRTITP